MSKKISSNSSSSIRAYALDLKRRALADLAKLPQRERSDVAQKLMAALGIATPHREQLFVDLIVEDIKARRKKSRVAA